jgi:hypothetical protein
MNTKQQQLIFDKGITNVPSDAICGDTALEVSEGIIYDGYGNRAIQFPQFMRQTTNRLIFVHRVPGGGKNYIFAGTGTNSGKVYYARGQETGSSIRLFELWGNSGCTERPTTNQSIYVQVNGNLIAGDEPLVMSSESCQLKVSKTLSGDGVQFEYNCPSVSNMAGTHSGLSISSGTTVQISAGPSSHDFSSCVFSFGDIVNRIGEDTQITGLTVDTDITEKQIQSIGKTIIFATSGGLVYAIWTGGGYRVYDHIPEPQIEFIMRGDNPYTLNSSYKVGNSENVSGLVDLGKNAALATPNYEKQNEYNNVVLGLYAKNVKSIKEKKGFCEPFMARAALRMYDGSYAYISQPVPLFPSVTKSTWGTASGSWGAATPPVLSVGTGFARLYFKQTENYEDFTDLVKEVTIFVSDGVNIYDTLIDQPLKGIGTDGAELTNRVTWDGGSNLYAIYSHSVYPTNGTQRHYQVLAERPTAEIKKDLESTSVFFKLCDIGVKAISSYTSTESYIDSHTLENLTTQEQLKHDDYFSRSKLHAEVLYAYNERLNLAGVKRDMFEGFETMIPYADYNPDQYGHTIRVRIKTDSGYRYVSLGEAPDYILTKNRMDIWFYYPDPRADWVTIIRHDTTNNRDLTILNTALTEHPGLNGAYYFRGLPTGSENYVDGGSVGIITDTNVTDSLKTEELPNMMLTSEVANPFVFFAEGYNRVGNGKIIAMSTTTQALSQGQFGQYPLIVFTEDEGIWAMSVDNTGMYQSVRPLSRELCNNVHSITQTDGEIFFSSERGLMCITGSQVTCVSKQLSGNGTFREFLKRSVIAYDCRDNMLWISNGGQKSMVYSIGSGAFGEVTGGFGHVVQSYPDALLLQGSDVYSLLERPNPSDDETGYDVTMRTRPMKLENGLGMKTLLKIVHISTLTNAELDVKLWGSNDLKTWRPLTSLMGTPWKYFKMEVKILGMKARDVYDGAVVTTQERRNEKLR